MRQIHKANDPQIHWDFLTAAGCEYRVYGRTAPILATRIVPGMLVQPFNPVTRRKITVNHEHLNSVPYQRD